MIAQLLRQLGLNENEISVYTAVMERGKSAAQPLAKKTGLPRTTVYSVMNNLMEKGLVVKEERKGTTYFSMSDSASFKDLIDREKRAIDLKEHAAAQLSTLMESISKGMFFSIPRIEFYEGKARVEEVLVSHYAEWQQSLSQYDSCWWGFQDHTFVEEFPECLKYHWQKFMPDEKVRFLSNNSKTEKQLKGKVRNRTMRFLKGFDCTGSLWICGDYIILLMTRQRPFYLVEIKDAVLSSNLRQVFKMMWELTDRSLKK